MSKRKKDDDYLISRKSHYDRSPHRSRSRSVEERKKDLKKSSRSGKDDDRSRRDSREAKKDQKGSSFYDSYKKLKQIQLEKASENGKVVPFSGGKDRDIPDHGVKKRKRRSKSNSSSSRGSNSRKRRSSKGDKDTNDRSSNHRERSSKHSVKSSQRSHNRSSQSDDSDDSSRNRSKNIRNDKTSQDSSKKSPSANPFKKKSMNEKPDVRVSPKLEAIDDNPKTEVTNGEDNGSMDAAVKQETDDQENVKENEDGVNSCSEMAPFVMVKRHPFTIMPCNVLLDLLHYAPFMSNRSLDELRLKYPVSSGKDHFKFNEKYFYESGSSSRHKRSSESSRSSKTKPPKSVFPEKPVNKSEMKQLVKRKNNLKEQVQKNRYDTEAQVELHEVERKLSDLKAACRKPGIFTGAIELRPMSIVALDVPDPDNLTVAKPDMFTYSHNFLHDHKTLGFKLLKDMGWIPGKGLGKISTNTALHGSAQAEKVNLFPADLKFSTEDKLGLCGAEEEMGSGLLYNQLATMDGKNPVSVLAEHCRVNNWGFPIYEMMGESGPLHKRAFHYKVRVNNVDYVPHTGSSSKKQAKADAATGALFALGLIGTSST